MQHLVSGLPSRPADDHTSCACSRGRQPTSAGASCRDRPDFQAGVRVPKDWTSAPAMRRREVRVREKDGRTTLVRLIEYE